MEEPVEVTFNLSSFSQIFFPLFVLLKMFGIIFNVFVGRMSGIIEGNEWSVYRKQKYRNASKFLLKLGDYVAIPLIVSYACNLIPGYVYDPGWWYFLKDEYHYASWYATFRVIRLIIDQLPITTRMSIPGAFLRGDSDLFLDWVFSFAGLILILFRLIISTWKEAGPSSVGSCQRSVVFSCGPSLENYILKTKKDPCKVFFYI